MTTNSHKIFAIAINNLKNKLNPNVVQICNKAYTDYCKHNINSSLPTSTEQFKNNGFTYYELNNEYGQIITHKNGDKTYNEVIQSNFKTQAVEKLEFRVSDESMDYLEIVWSNENKTSKYNVILDHIIIKKDAEPFDRIYRYSKLLIFTKQTAPSTSIEKYIYTDTSLSLHDIRTILNK